MEILLRSGICILGESPFWRTKILESQEHGEPGPWFVRVEPGFWRAMISKKPGSWRARILEGQGFGEAEYRRAISLENHFKIK